METQSPLRSGIPCIQAIPSPVVHLLIDIPDPSANHFPDLDATDIIVQSFLQLESRSHDVCIIQMDRDIMEDDVLCSISHIDSSYQLVDRDTIPVSCANYQQNLYAPEIIVQSYLQPDSPCHDVCVIQADIYSTKRIG